MYVYSVITKSRKSAYLAYDPKLRLRFRFVARVSDMTGTFLNVVRHSGMVVFIPYAGDNRRYKLNDETLREWMDGEERSLFIRPRPHRCM